MAKPTIVTRAGKGSALTWTEGDANVTNLRDATITVAADSGTSQVLDLNDTLTIVGGTNLNSVASATDTITLNLDTTVTGLTSLTSTTVVAGTVTTSGATDLLLHTNANVNSGVITIQDGVGGDITVVPNGTGKVHFETSETRVGINNTNAKITTKGAGDLTLDTNSGTNSGSIVILDGVNGNITLTPNGTGSIVLDGVNWPQADGSVGQVLTTNGTGQLSYSSPSTAVGSITGLGTSVATALAVNVGTDGAVLVRGGALGTPSGGILTNATGLPVSTGVSGLGSGVATFLATPSSANLISAITDESGTGGLLFANSPTLITPALGTPASGTVTNLTGTASININGTVGATTKAAGTFTTMTADVSVLDDIRETVAALTYGATITPDAADGSIRTVTLTGNVTFSAFSNPVSGQTITLIITQDGTGSRTLTSTMKFAGASKTLSTAASSIDILNVSYIGTTYYASLIKGYA